MNDQNKLRLVLQFLALDNQRKLVALPKMPMGKELSIYETNIKTDNPLFCLVYECFVCIEQNKFGNDEMASILNEMECLIDEMISHKSQSWIWDTGDPGLSASSHLFWAILKRLAREALRLQNWPMEAPLLSQDFITIGKWVPKSQ